MARRQPFLRRIDAGYFHHRIHGHLLDCLRRRHKINDSEQRAILRWSETDLDVRAILRPREVSRIALRDPDFTGRIWRTQALQLPAAVEHRTRLAGLVELGHDTADFGDLLRLLLPDSGARDHNRDS